ncbi:MAG: archaeosortase A [Halobacteria archaeon]
MIGIDILYWDVFSVEMIAVYLWLVMGLLIIASILNTISIAAVAWMLYGVYWLTQPLKFLDYGDWFNAVLTLLGSFFCFGIAYFSYIAYTKKRNDDTLITATRVAALGGIYYFSFAEIEPLNLWLRSLVTDQTMWLLNSLAIPAIKLDPIHIYFKSQTVEIILACTAIESMALFAGLTLCINAPLRNRLLAFLISVPVVYILNLFRNAFVIAAYGYEWFGSAEESFYIAHHVISKFASLAALILIAYYVFKILPELLEFISNIIDMFVDKFGKGGKNGTPR